MTGKTRNLVRIYENQDLTSLNGRIEGRIGINFVVFLDLGTFWIRVNFLVLTKLLVYTLYKAQRM